MTNPSLSLLSDYPFQRLRDLIDHITPDGNRAPLALSIGEPQHQPPLLLTKTLAENGHLWNKYPPVAGSPELREAILQWLERRFHLGGSLDLKQAIVPLSGSREGLFLIGNAILAPSGEGKKKPLVLVPNPFYQVYIGAAVMNAAEVEMMPAGAELGFQPDLDAISEASLHRAQMMFLCTPGNPQGSIASLEYLKKAVELARRYDFVLVVDECYGELYDKVAPVGALEACKALGGSLKNVISFHSLSKRSNAAGLRSGFAVGDPDVIKSFTHLRNYGGATLPLPIMAASAALWSDDAHVEENRALYREKIDAAERILGNRLGFYRPPGGFFLWLDVRERWANGEEAARELWQKAAVRVVPGAYLARSDSAGTNPGDAYIRVALVHEQSLVTEALGRIAEIL